jgi:tetratricopeptide (TPR) repeat protein
MKRFAPVLLILLTAGFMAGVAFGQDAKVLISRAIEAMEAGKYDQALQDFGQALKLKPNDPAIYDYLGVAKRGKNLNDQALQDFNKAIQLDPKFARAYRDRAMVYYDQTDYDKSLTDLLQARSLGYQVDEDFVKMVRRKAAEKK